MTIHTFISVPADSDHAGARDTLKEITKKYQPDSGRALLADALAKISIAPSATAALADLNKTSVAHAVKGMATNSASGQLQRIAAESLDWSTKLREEIDHHSLSVARALDLRTDLRRLIDGLRHVEMDNLTNDEADAANGVGSALETTEDTLAETIAKLTADLAQSRAENTELSAAFADQRGKLAVALTQIETIAGALRKLNASPESAPRPADVLHAVDAVRQVVEEDELATAGVARLETICVRSKFKPRALTEHKRSKSKVIGDTVRNLITCADAELEASGHPPLSRVDPEFRAADVTTIVCGLFPNFEEPTVKRAVAKKLKEMNFIFPLGTPGGPKAELEAKAKQRQDRLLELAEGGGFSQPQEKERAA